MRWPPRGRSPLLPLLLWARGCAPAGAAGAGGGWPNVYEDFANGGWDGVLGYGAARREHRDYRQQRRLEALALLLVHHGVRECEPFLSDNPFHLEGVRGAIEEFQRRNGLAADATQLGDSFWSAALVPAVPGDRSAAALALRWLLDSAEAAARPPLWDAATVDHDHGCVAPFDELLVRRLLSHPSSADVGVGSLNDLAGGLQQSHWAALLGEPEVPAAAGCGPRRGCLHAFAVVWALTWLAMAVAFTFGHVPTSEESRLASDGELAPRRTAMRLTRSDSRRLAWHSRWMMGASGRAVNCLMLVGSTVCHSLAAVGMWMFPQDFLKELLVGVYFAAAGLIITRLSSEGGNQPMFRRAIEAAILLTLFLSVYLLVVVFPYNHGLWMNIILAVVVVMWSWATAALSKQARAARFVLLCAVCFLSAVFPTFFAMAVRNVTSFTLWTPALAPTGLLIVSFFSEEVVGHLMVKHCEFTAETQWMLAIVFRFCVEAVRFNTALSVILLLQVSKASWWWLVLHLVQTALYETVWIFRRLWDQNQANSVSTLGESTAEGGLPFTNGEIVLRTCFHPCQYRARAAMLPIEASLLLAHVCQLATMGMPVGPSTGAWVGGIGCIGGAALCREGAIAVLGRTFQSTMPTMPWAKLPVHLVAMMTGVGAVTAIFAQVQNHWLLYAHHWAACFLGGPGHDEGTDISKEWERTFALAATAFLCAAAWLGAVAAFAHWARWRALLREGRAARRPAAQPPRPQLKAMRSLLSVLPGEGGAGAGGGGGTWPFVRQDSVGWGKALRELDSDSDSGEEESEGDPITPCASGDRRPSGFALREGCDGGPALPHEVPLEQSAADLLAKLRGAGATIRGSGRGSAEPASEAVSGSKAPPSWPGGQPDNAATEHAAKEVDDRHREGAYMTRDVVAQLSEISTLRDPGDDDPDEDTVKVDLRHRDTAYLISDAMKELSETGPTAVFQDTGDDAVEASRKVDTDEDTVKVDLRHRDTAYLISDAMKELSETGPTVVFQDTGDALAEPEPESGPRATLGTLALNQLITDLVEESPRGEDLPEEAFEQLLRPSLSEQAAAKRARAEQEEAEAARANEEARRKREEAEARRALQEAKEEAIRAKREAAADALLSALRGRDRAVLEQRLREAVALQIGQERIEEAALLLEELLAEERRAACRERLRAAQRSGSAAELEDAIAEAWASGLPAEDVAEAEREMAAIIEQERVAAMAREAGLRLAEVMRGVDASELEDAIKHAEEMGVDPARVAAAKAQLQSMLRRAAAERQLRAALAALGNGRSATQDFSAAGSLKSRRSLKDAVVELEALQARLGESIRLLEKPLEEARAAGVAAASTAPAEARLAALHAEKRRLDATVALQGALEAQDIDGVKAALEEAHAAKVKDAMVRMAEEELKQMMKEAEVANDKMAMLKLQLGSAVQARLQAEQAQTSAEVAAMLDHRGIVVKLGALIEEAREVKFIKKKELQKVETVLSEVTTALKRTLEEKQLMEKRREEEALAAAGERARTASPLTHLVLASLKMAIAQALEWAVSVEKAEALLARLSTDHERLVAEAKEELAASIGSGNPALITARIDRCQAMLLPDEVVVDAVGKLDEAIRAIIQKSFKDPSREKRLATVTHCQRLVELMREHGITKDLRQLHNDIQDLKGGLRVFCRIRPISSKEGQRGDEVAVRAEDALHVSVLDRGQRQSFCYDTVFGPESSQDEVFADCRSLVQSALDGYNVTIFCYGQTGAGKTWTLYGSGKEPGVSPRTCEEVFAMIERDRDKYEAEVKASMVELYVNDLRDLLTTEREPPKLDFKSVRQGDGSVSVQLDGVVERPATSAKDLAKTIGDGLSKRKVQATNMNAVSSRSHLMFIIKLQITDRITGRSRPGKITLVDMAGSERLAKSGVSGEGAKEAIEINKSLTALGDVMGALTAKAKVIPYRNHKLTQLMQDSLGGQAKTLMFVNLSPSSYNSDETICALKYATRARSIENTVVRRGD